MMIYILFFLFLAFQACNETFDAQGHRGARGNFPENSIAGHKFAYNVGVTTLELDVCISKDKKVFLSHEPWINPKICLSPSGEIIPDTMGKRLNTYKMLYEEIKKYDSGSKTYKRFPEQKKLKSYKPLLSELIDSIEAEVNYRKKRRVYYNIEIKSTPEDDNIFHPEPKEFADLLISILKNKQILKYSYIQSFDLRPLQYIKKNYPGIKLVFLVENKKHFNINIEELGFKPDIYSPDHNLVSHEMIGTLHHKSIKIIPWTVNESYQMNRLINMGVDGIITDYPQKLVEILKKKNIHF